MINVVVVASPLMPWCCAYSWEGVYRLIHSASEAPYIGAGATTGVVNPPYTPILGRLHTLTQTLAGFSIPQSPGSFPNLLSLLPPSPPPWLLPIRVLINESMMIYSGLRVYDTFLDPVIHGIPGDILNWTLVLW